MTIEQMLAIAIIVVVLVMVVCGLLPQKRRDP